MVTAIPMKGTSMKFILTVIAFSVLTGFSFAQETDYTQVLTALKKSLDAQDYAAAQSSVGVLRSLIADKIAQLNAGKYLDYRKIYQDFQDNQARATKIYSGKRLTIQGVISEIAADYNDSFTKVPVVKMPTDTIGLRAVVFYFDPSQGDALAALDKGQSIAIEGTVKDFDSSGTDLHVMDCKVVK